MTLLPTILVPYIVRERRQTALGGSIREALHSATSSMFLALRIFVGCPALCYLVLAMLFTSLVGSGFSFGIILLVNECDFSDKKADSLFAWMNLMALVFNPVVGLLTDFLSTHNGPDSKVYFVVVQVAALPLPMWLSTLTAVSQGQCAARVRPGRFFGTRHATRGRVNLRDKLTRRSSPPSAQYAMPLMFSEAKPMRIN